MAWLIARIRYIILHALLMAKPVKGMATLPMNGTSSGQQTNGSIVVRRGVLFQNLDFYDIYYLVGALAQYNAASIYDQNLRRQHRLLIAGRTGNRFVDLSQFLAMGYCCRSKLLQLPLRDREIPAQDGEQFISGNNLFDFSAVDILPLEEFRNISDQDYVCPQLIELRGSGGFRLQGIHPDLLRCMNRVYLRGCEASYLGGLVETWNVCPAHETPPTSATSPQGVYLTMEGPFDKSEAGTAGSLVVQIRSGDIFSKPRISSRHGQPPLQFYLDAIANQPWSEVSVVTFAKRKKLVNPIYTRIQEMTKEGLLGQNITFYMNRAFKIDLEAMLCADGISLARSSLAIFISAHTRASYLYVPSECGPGIYGREVRSKGSPRVLMDNTTLLARERPDAQVYGIEWAKGPSAYSVYTDFKNTPQQRMEMLESDSIKGLQQCHIGK